MHHCHPCFGGHKPVGPICTTAPVIHPTKQCVTHSFSTTVVPHIFPTHTTHVHHQQIKNQNFFPQTNSNVNVASNRSRIWRWMWTMWSWSPSPRSSNISIWTRAECISIWTRTECIPIWTRTECIPVWTRTECRTKCWTKRWWNI